MTHDLGIRRSHPEPDALTWVRPLSPAKLGVGREGGAKADGPMA